MKRNKEQIIKDINILLQELSSGVNIPNSSGSMIISANKEIKKGCIGALQLLINEGFFSELRSLEEVLQKLKEEGEPYSRALVSMNLLNLVKRKVLRRIEQKDKWQYIVRK